LKNYYAWVTGVMLRLVTDCPDVSLILTKISLVEELELLSDPKVQPIAVLFSAVLRGKI